MIIILIWLTILILVRLAVAADERDLRAAQSPVEE